LSQKVVLQTQDWHYTCGDGCCDDYGQRLFVNGDDIEADMYSNAYDAIEKVLKQLGYEVEWDELEDDRIDSRIDFDGDED
jgi:hypothetical protein